MYAIKYKKNFRTLSGVLALIMLILPAAAYGGHGGGGGGGRGGEQAASSDRPQASAPAERSAGGEEWSPLLHAA